MGKRKAGRGETLEPGQVDVKETRHYRRHATDEGQLPIDGWLLTIGARQDLSHVAVYKHQRDGRGQLKYQLLPDRIDAPCDIDPGELFRKWGDGDYKFSAIKTDHSFLTHKLESVTGFGAGERGGASASAARGGADPLESTLTEMNNFMRQSIVSAQLRSLYRELTRESSSGGNGAAGAPSAAEESALHAATFDRLLEQMVKMKTLVGATGGGELTGQLVTRLVDKALTPPEPAERSIDTVSRLLEFADRLNARAGAGAGGGELDLTSLAVVTILGIAAQSPELKAMLGQLVSKYAPALLEKLPGARRAAAADVPPLEVPPPPSAEPAPPAPPGATRPPGRGPESPQVTVLRTLVYPMIRRAIELKSDDFETYERILENHLPGFLDTWSGMPLEDALTYVRELDPVFLSTPEAREWLRGFYVFAKEADTRPA